MFSAALACGLCVALSMPAYGAEVRGDITSDIVYDGQDWVVILVSDRMIMAGGE